MPLTALDTNILVRTLTNDDPSQAGRAARILSHDDTFVAKTVILETEWVLTHAYGVGREAIADAFRRLFGLPRLHVEDDETVIQALALYEEGLDFADALHLASSAKADRFATFDKALARKASRVFTLDILTP
jgi:predicted nucleic-acid-binding protein